MANNRFSIAAVLLSYFLVAGGMALGILLLVQLGVTGEAAFYGSLALGGAIGGALAARASRGSTIVEPAIGGLLVIVTLVAVFVGTEAGAVLWHAAKDEIMRTVMIAGAAAAAGAILGAVLAEKVAGGHAEGGLSWLVLVAIAMLGACFVSTVVLVGAAVRGTSSPDTLAGMFFIAMAIGALLAGLTAGASAPRRILLINLIGVLIGVMGYYLMIAGLPGFHSKDDEQGKVALGFAVIGLGCGLIAMLGAAIGWSTVGKRHAAAAAGGSRAFE